VVQAFLSSQDTAPCVHAPDTHLSIVQYFPSSQSLSTVQVEVPQFGIAL